MSVKHAVTLDEERCRGCTSCIKSCPAEAIRVRNGKAAILDDRCIDCGKCIGVCRHRAIRSKADSLDCLSSFDHCVALPEPALYGQFPQPTDINLVLNALLELGFHDVFEVSRAGALLDGYTSHTDLDTDTPMPQISAACPTVLRLIRIRFPRLIAHVPNTMLPMELAAILARREACAKTGLPPERIGVFAIVPCSAKLTIAHNPEALEHPVIDGALSIRDVCRRLPVAMRALTERHAALRPLYLPRSLPEGLPQGGLRCITADGVENVTRLLEDLEDGRIMDVDFVALSACARGCFGGCFTVENPHAAQMRMHCLTDGVPANASDAMTLNELAPLLHDVQPLQYLPSLVLDEDLAAAMEKQRNIQQLEAHLPGLHCASCGAPSCHAFAEDVVLGRATEDDCIFKVRARMRALDAPGEPDDYLPAPFRRRAAKPEKKSPAHNRPGR